MLKALAIGEMQIKTTRYHYTTIRMAKFKKQWQHQMMATMQRYWITQIASTNAKGLEKFGSFTKI